MFWNPGEKDVEIFANSFLLVSLVALELIFRVAGEKRKERSNYIGPSRDSSSHISSEPVSNKEPLTEIEHMEAEIRREESVLEGLNNPNTFVEYAMGQRRLNLKRRELEIIKERETKKQEPQPSSSSNMLSFMAKNQTATKIVENVLLQNRVSGLQNAANRLFQHFFYYFFFQIIICIFVYVLSFFLPAEVRSFLGWFKIASTSFVSSTACSQLLSFRMKQFQAVFKTEKVNRTPESKVSDKEDKKDQ